tara:strand:- start:4185 stop:4871 length:687 start_codon:yes stop_codon:yes gene_type:complete
LGDGILGSKLHELTGWDYISRKKDGIDFTDFNSYSEYILSYSEVINCIANTDTYSDDREVHWDVNYKGVVDLVDYISTKACHMKLTHISTDYIYTHSVDNASESDVPVHCNNWYGYTKLLSDAYIQLKLKKFLLLRGTHKEEPFIYPKAWKNQKGNFDYVSVISKLYVRLIENDSYGVYNVGTDVKTMYDLAKRTKLDVEAVDGIGMPANVTMDTNKLRGVLDVKSFI